MATVQELARILADSLVKDTRADGTAFVKTTDNAPEWIKDVVHAAHGNLLPDDWIYEQVQAMADLIANGYDDEGIKADIYNRQLIEWLAKYPDADSAVDEYYDELGGERGSLMEQLQCGQWYAKDQIYHAVYAALEELSEQEEESTEA